MRTASQVRQMPLALVLASAPVVAQQTWVVDAAGGPGANFTDVPPAVAAAAPGDTLLIRSGTYTPPIAISKGLTLSPESSGDVAVFSPATLDIAGLPMGQRCALKSLHGVGGNPLLLRCADNLGSVHVEDLRWFRPWINRCSQVTLASCRGPTGYIKDSVVSISTSEFIGGVGVYGMGASPGLYIENSRLTLQETDAQGEDCISYCYSYCCRAAPGVFLRNSEVLLIGGVLRGGTAYHLFYGSFRTWSANGTGTLTNSGGALPDGTLGVQLRAASVASLSARVGRPAGTLTTTLAVAPNAPVALLASLPRAGGPIPFGAVSGWPGVWIDELAFLVLFQGMAPSAGPLTRTYSLSKPPEIYNIPLMLQAVYLDPGVQLSNGVAVVLAPAS